MAPGRSDVEYKRLDNRASIFFLTFNSENNPGTKETRMWFGGDRKFGKKKLRNRFNSTAASLPRQLMAVWCSPVANLTRTLIEQFTKHRWSWSQRQAHLEHWREHTPYLDHGVGWIGMFLSKLTWRGTEWYPGRSDVTTSTKTAKWHNTDAHHRLGIAVS